MTCLRASFLLASCAATFACLPGAALAQRTADNVTTQSEDAFGRSVGNDRSGLYNADDVRGFNPVDAGNVRLGGLYIDVIERVPTRMLQGSTIRVGIAAQRYSFPAPTGLVDYDVNVPDGSWYASLQVDNGNSSNNGYGTNGEASMPILGDKVSAFISFAAREARRPEGGSHHGRGLGATIAVRPGGGAEILLLAGGNFSRGEEARATLFPAGTAMPPRVQRGLYLGQDWTGRASDTSLFGSVARIPLGPVRLEAGVFQSKRAFFRNFSDNLSGVTPDGLAANRVVVATFGNTEESLSGEARVVRDWKTGAVDHSLTLSMRGRNKYRLFGGARRIVLGPSSAVAPDFRTAPAIVPGTLDHDRVRQRTFGFAYSAIWHGRASVDVGLSWSKYRKAVDFSTPGVADPVTIDRPLLLNVSGSVALARNLIVFAGYTRGQEEALIAPDVATNRSEAPPALRTAQLEFGARLGISPGVTMILGGFRITKPYYNLDPVQRYRQLGTLANQGLELSLAGQMLPGLTVVGGALLLDPKVSGEAVDAGLIGPRPVGQIRMRSVLNVDWRPKGGKSPFSFDMALESVSSRTANIANTLAAPPRTTVNFGTRYRFKRGPNSFVARAQLQNAFNNYGWNVNASGGWTYTNPRYLMVQLVGDF
jgi:iron complex outermembrane receptor protein